MTTYGPGAGGSGGRSVTSAIWRAGAIPAAVVGGLVAVISLTGGLDAVLGALVGTALSIAALSVPVLVVRATATASPPAVMGAALGGYLLCVVLLAIAWIVLEGVDTVSHQHLAVALFAVTAAWMAGQVRGLVRLRVLAFGESADGAEAGRDTPGHGRGAGPTEPAGH